MKLTGEFCESLYSTMVKIRRFDEKVAELFQQGIVKGTAHSYVGQEAVAAGACANLRVDDFIVSNFNAGTTETFPLYVFGAHLRGIPVQVNVLATMLFLVTVIAICFVLWQQRRAERMASVRPDPEV